VHAYAIILTVTRNVQTLEYRTRERRKSELTFLRRLGAWIYWYWQWLYLPHNHIYSSTHMTKEIKYNNRRK